MILQRLERNFIKPKMGVLCSKNCISNEQCITVPLLPRRAFHFMKNKEAEVGFQNGGRVHLFSSIFGMT
jgi:hypothetical protein